MPATSTVRTTLPEASRLAVETDARCKVKNTERMGGTPRAGPTGWLFEARGCTTNPPSPNNPCGDSVKARLPVVTGGGGGETGGVTLAVLVTVKKLPPKS